MSEYFVFDGVDSRSFSIAAFERSTHTGPARVYNSIDIPGKSGSVLVDGRRHPNVSHSYGCIIYKNCSQNLEGFREFLLSRSGYCRLEDSIHPDEFYMACYRESFEPVLDRERSMCKFQLVFERKPQRFLKIGELTTVLTSTGSIHNPTRFASQPLLRIRGNGKVGIGENEITLTDNTSYIDVDCEIMEAFTGTISKNANVSFSQNDFPVLHEGVNGITLGSGITNVEITPRWYRM